MEGNVASVEAGQFVDVMKDESEDGSPPETPSTASKTVDKDDVFVDIQVSNARQVGDGLAAVVVFDIVTTTNCPSYKELSAAEDESDPSVHVKSFVTVHRFSELIALHHHLCGRHSSDGVLVPPAPEKDALNSTRLRIGTDKLSDDIDRNTDSITTSLSTVAISSIDKQADHSDEAGGATTNSNRHAQPFWTKGEQFIEKRRMSIKRFLMRAANHSVLGQDSELRAFLTTESNADDVLFRGRTSNGGTNQHHATSNGNGSDSVLKKIGQMAVAKASALASTFGSSTQTLEETDPWFYHRANHYERLESLLRLALSTTDALADQRLTLAQNTRSLATLIDSLGHQYGSGSSAEDCKLASNLAHLAATYDTIATNVHAKQGRDDALILGVGCLKDYLAMVVAVREAFEVRSKLWLDWQALVANLVRKRESRGKAVSLADQHASLNNQPTSQTQTKLNEKVNALTSEVINGERAESAAQERFEEYQAAIRREVTTFEAEERTYLAQVVTKYIEAGARVQLDLTSDWDRYVSLVSADGQADDEK